MPEATHLPTKFPASSAKRDPDPVSPLSVAVLAWIMYSS